MKTWKYLTNEDYHSWIKKINNPSLKWKLISQYRSGRPLLYTAYLKLLSNHLKK